MNSTTWRSWLTATAVALAATMPAHAAVVTFEDAMPELTGGAGVLSSGGYKFTGDGTGDFFGIDTAASLSGFGAPPANPDGQFLFMLNSAGIGMTAQSGEGFFLSSFDAAFIAPTPLLGGFLPGKLSVALYDLLGVLFSTEVFEFGTGAAGEDFPFQTISLSNTAALSQADFFSCTYQTTGECTRYDLVPAQFALDNIVERAATNRVPEPGSAVLTLTALGALLIGRRRAAGARVATTSAKELT